MVEGNQFGQQCSRGGGTPRRRDRFGDGRGGRGGFGAGTPRANDKPNLSEAFNLAALPNGEGGASLHQATQSPNGQGFGTPVSAPAKIDKTAALVPAKVEKKTKKSGPFFG